MSSVASRGVLLGACAGLLLGLNDFGAMWLWLDMAGDRWALLTRVTGICAPMGSLLCALTLAITTPTQRSLARRAPAWNTATRWGASYAMLLAPACTWLAWQLFRGGSASRVPGVEFWKPLTALLLIGGVSFGVTGVVYARAYAERRGLLVWLGVGYIVGAHGLIKINQWVLPNLYDYLHALLALLAFAGLALGVEALVRSRAPSFTGPQLHALAGMVGLTLALSFVATLRALPHNQNVAVALLDARAAHTRTWMLAAAPWLQAERPRPRQRRAPPRETAQPVAAGPGSQGTHILLITIDALRADHLGLYGYARPTSPKLNALAAESLVFERAYAQAPHSSYSLSSLMTSEYLHETLDLGHPPPTATLANTLSAAGYHTAAFYTLGIFHTAAERLSNYEKSAFGFALHDHQDREPEALTDRVLAEIDRIIAQGEPSSLIWAHYFNVHEPYRATTFGTSDMDRYDSEIVRADAAVERLIREAKRKFQRDVIAVVTADHGEEFRDHGGVYHGSTLYEEQVRVPLIVHGEGIKPQRFAPPVELVDVTPTLLSWVDVGRAASMRGDDLRTFLAGQPTSPPPVFSAVIHKRMVVKWPHKLIADLRFGLYELYALDADPSERKNLATSHPSQLEQLRGEVYGWLDSLALDEQHNADPRALALDQGRLGDRRAVPQLVALIQDESADLSMRREAGAMLGKLADPNATAGLLAALNSREPSVAAEAAIALGRMHHTGGQTLLRTLVAAEDPDVRCRAAVSLGRLRDVAAVPALIDALWVAPNDYEREEAIRWLGRLRDPRAIEPLISLLPESRTRHLVVVALGAIGDPRAYDTLADVLRWEDHANVRDSTVRALGMLKDPRALPLLVRLTATEATLKHATESLVRLDALGMGAVGGSDVGPRVKHQGFRRCSEFSERHDWDYLHRTTCETARAQVTVHATIPPAIAKAQQGVVAVIAARRVDAPEPASLDIRIGSLPAHTLTVDGTWSEQRWALPEGELGTGPTRITLSAAPSDARFAIDHVLVVPR